MLVASIAASVCGGAIGSRWGIGGVVLGAVAGVVLAAFLVFIVNAVLIMQTRNMGLDRHALEERAALFAARIAAIGAAVAAAVVVLLTVR
jgi:hypothetical protein